MTFKEFAYKTIEERGGVLFPWQKEVIERMSDAMEKGEELKIIFARGDSNNGIQGLLKAYFIEELKEKYGRKGEKIMKLSEFMKKYGDCEVTEEMEKCIKKPKGKWKPSEGELYYCVNSVGIIEECRHDTSNRLDNFRRDFVRMFKTKEEARRYLEIMKAYKEASFEPDWEDANQSKYYFRYNYFTKGLCINKVYMCSTNCQLYFKSYEKARDLIIKFGEKDIAKYVLGVEVE